MQTDQQITESEQIFFKSYGLDPLLGYNVLEDYVPKCFNKAPIINCLTNLHEKILNKQVAEFAEKMPSLNLNLEDSSIDAFTRERDCTYLHALNCDLINAYILEKRNEGLPDCDIVLPRNLGVPHYQICEFLGIKYGMCGEYYANWKLKVSYKTIPDSLHVSMISRVYFFCQPEDQDDERLFFGGSMNGSFHLFNSIKLLYRLIIHIERQPEKCQSIFIKTMQQITQKVKRINESNLFILDNMHENFLVGKLRKYLFGWKEIQIEGMEQRISSDGGAGGFDPCYQIFERAMGINFSGALSNAQGVFRNGFPKSVNRLIADMEKISLIRDFCELNPEVSQSYNKVVEEYSNFYVIHRQFLNKFILKGQDPSKHIGSGGTKISDIMSRNEEIKKQTL